MLRRGRGVFQKIPRGEKVKEEVFERNGKKYRRRPYYYHFKALRRA